MYFVLLASLHRVIHGVCTTLLGVFHKLSTWHTQGGFVVTGGVAYGVVIPPSGGLFGGLSVGAD
ncbi:hypothetical protein GCM10009811_31080 [Nostocoides veronense]|uniref:Secreted protein n=1 Tax=Nostocoides veronense TaxID=330836 RepID=A0ABP4YCD1_9MICO